MRFTLRHSQDLCLAYADIPKSSLCSEELLDEQANRLLHLKDETMSYLYNPEDINNVRVNCIPQANIEHIRVPFHIDPGFIRYAVYYVYDITNYEKIEHETADKLTLVIREIIPGLQSIDNSITTNTGDELYFEIDGAHASAKGGAAIHFNAVDDNGTVRSTSAESGESTQLNQIKNIITSLL